MSFDPYNFEEAAQMQANTRLWVG